MTITVSNSGLISTNAQGINQNGSTTSPSFAQWSRDMIVYTSAASNLVAGDTNNYPDVFIKDLSTGLITRVSTSGTGEQGNGIALNATFSPDGKSVLFSTFASNMVTNDTNNAEDLFLKNLETGEITVVSKGIQGALANGFSTGGVFSGDGSKIAFATEGRNLGPHDLNGASDVYIHDLKTGIVTLASRGPSGEGNSFSDQPSLSYDGTMLAFRSRASNFVADDADATEDIFVKNLNTGAIEQVTVGLGGAQANSDSGNPVMSADGTKVLFYSGASNLVADDTGGRVDIFVKDLITGVITRVSETAAGVGANGDSEGAVFSPDGHLVAFVTTANNLGATDTNNTQDVYIKNLVTGELTLVSRTNAGPAGNSYSVNPEFSADGTKIIYQSAATNISGGGVGDDIFIATVSGNPYVITGKAGNETINGSAENDVIDGVGGKDKIYAGGGHDTVWAGTGTSSLFGGEGNDVLHGRGGDDGLYGENGNDYLYGGAGADKMSGGAGSDHIWGDAGSDIIFGNDGEDFLHGNEGDDVMYGDSSSDRLDGDAGDDEMHGGSSADLLIGGADNDTIHGDGGSDAIFGDNGNDTLYGGTGTNTIHGGAGADIFVLNTDAFDAHADKISDFSVSQDDVLRLDDILSGFDPLADSITDFVSATAYGVNNTMIAIDRDGSGGTYGFENVAILDNVQSVNVQTLYDDGNIVVNNSVIV